MTWGAGMRDAYRILFVSSQSGEIAWDSEVMLKKKIKKTSVSSVRKRTIPTERLPLVSEVSANFSS
jgi:hypothetical protein